MATLTKRGSGQWQAKIRKKGYPTQSNTFDTKAKAERWARHIESEMDKGVFVSTAEAEQTTLEELFERYEDEVLPSKKSHRRIKSSIKTINDYLGSYTLAALTPKVISAYRNERLKDVKGDTVRKDLLLISRTLKHAQQEWEIYLPRGNPVDSIKIPNQAKGRERRLQLGEEQKLIQEAKKYGGELEHIILLALETGMRRGELSELRWKDVDLKKRTATLWDTKNGDNRVVPLSSKALTLLGSLPINIKGHVFAMLPDSITKAFNRICERAKIEELRFHDLRHEATSRFFEMGLSIMEVSSIIGHKDLSMLKRYTHLKAEDLAKKLN